MQTPRLWFTSDTHFGHARILELSNRPFETVEQHDAALIRAINERVRPTDTLIHLGDLAMGPFMDSIALTTQLHGRRFLVPGNHDRVSQAYERGRQIDRWRPVYEDAGWEILPESVVLDIAAAEPTFYTPDDYAAATNPVLLSHYPYTGDHTDTDRYQHLRPKDTGLPLLHGHIHQERFIDGRMFNVGVDVHQYLPVSAYQVLNWLIDLDGAGKD